MNEWLSLLFGGFISKVINDGADITKRKIKSVVDDRNNRNFSTKLYRVIEKTLNEVTGNNFKGTEGLYDAIECIFRDYESNGNDIRAIKSGFNILGLHAGDYECDEFMERFCARICKDEELRNMISLILQKLGFEKSEEISQMIIKTFENNHKEHDIMLKKIDAIPQNVYKLFSENNQSIDIREKKFQNNRKQAYIENWNSKLFLHIDNDERPITLADAFIMPDFYIHRKNKRMDFSAQDTLEDIIDKFVKYERNASMLIVGEPGIGKSSITSYIANTYKKNDRLIILRFRDWECEELEYGLLKAICNILGCKKNDLKNKIIVLDGFDEIKSLDMRNELLSAFFSDILDIMHLKLIITSRIGYITYDNFQNVIKILPFDFIRIRKFYKIVTGNELEEKPIDLFLKDFHMKNSDVLEILHEKSEILGMAYENSDILGIPVILYMTIMSEIDITRNITKPELYNCIFSEKNGIFDKFTRQGISYDDGAQLMRDKQNIKSYMSFLREIAFKMFEENSLTLVRKNYQLPKLQFQNKLVSIIEFPIKHLFESTDNYIEFIHKTIYEYFVSEYFFFSINNNINGSKEDLADILGSIMKSNIVSDEILDFLKYRISSSELKDNLDYLKETFQLMMENGMTYYTKKIYKNVITCEMSVFNNILNIIHTCANKYVKYDSSISKYLKYNKDDGINLRKMDIGIEESEKNISKGIDLSNTYLVQADLRESILIGANLEETDLRKADLSEANLSRANLIGANLAEAKLTKVNLTGANLSKADLRGAVLDRVEFYETDLVFTIFDEEQVEMIIDKMYNCLRNIKVYIVKTQEIMDFKKYCEEREKRDV